MVFPTPETQRLEMISCVVSPVVRERVSIAEASLSGANINVGIMPPEGLDAATALEFIRALKTAAAILDATPLIAIYRCSQDAYDLFDNVICAFMKVIKFTLEKLPVLRRFRNMGYRCPQRQTTADYLTSLTNPAERIVRPGYENKVPRT